MIIGATSCIAEAVSKRYAKRGYEFYLVARNENRLKDLANDLKIRGAKSVNYGNHETITESLHNIDIVLIAYGTLGDQKACEQNVGLALQELNTNAISIMTLLTELANYFEQQKSGTIAVISSVAGDRGRQSNYIYGAAKGAVSIFLQGLRNRLYKSGVNVLTIKPGFVDTPMTKDFKKGLLWSSPENIAKGIEKAIDKKKDCVYLPFWWWGIMAFIRIIPEKIFKRMSL